jgi:hypothetical protein
MNYVYLNPKSARDADCDDLKHVADLTTVCECMFGPHHVKDHSRSATRDL